MKFLADEAVDYPVVERLRRESWSVCSVLEDSPGISDREVLERAVAEERILISSDKDFGEMVFRQDHDVEGILLLRLPGLSPDDKAEIVLDVVEEKGESLESHFTVVDAEKIRMRRM